MRRNFSHKSSYSTLLAGCGQPFACLPNTSKLLARVKCCISSLGTLTLWGLHLHRWRFEGLVYSTIASLWYIVFLMHSFQGKNCFNEKIYRGNVFHYYKLRPKIYKKTLAHSKGAISIIRKGAFTRNVLHYANAWLWTPALTSARLSGLSHQLSILSRTLVPT